MPIFATIRNIFPAILLLTSCSHYSEKIAASENERYAPVEDVTGEIAFVNVNVVPMEDERVLNAQNEKDTAAFTHTGSYLAFCRQRLNNNRQGAATARQFFLKSMGWISGSSLKRFCLVIFRFDRAVALK